MRICLVDCIFIFYVGPILNIKVRYDNLEKIDFFGKRKENYKR